MAHVLMFDWKGDHFPFSLKKKKKSIFKWGLYPLLLKSHVFFTRPHWAERGLVPIPLVLLRVWWRMWSDSPCCLLVTPPPCGNICGQAKTIWELCFKELGVSTSGHKQLVLVSVETWFEAVEKHIREYLKFYKNWSRVCLLGLSNITSGLQVSLCHRHSWERSRQTTDSHAGGLPLCLGAHSCWFSGKLETYACGLWGTLPLHRHREVFLVPLPLQDYLSLQDRFME